MGLRPNRAVLAPLPRNSFLSIFAHCVVVVDGGETTSDDDDDDNDYEVMITELSL